MLCCWSAAAIGEDAVVIDSAFGLPCLLHVDDELPWPRTPGCAHKRDGPSPAVGPVGVRRPSSGDITCTAKCRVTAEQALCRASSLMEDYRLLEAERVFIESLEAMDPAEAEQLCEATLFKEVLQRRLQFESIGKMLLEDTGDDMELVWQRNGAQVWCRAVPNQNAIEVKAVIEVDAPLSACMVCGHELDLIPEWNKVLSEPPSTLGPKRLFHLVVHAKSQMLMLSFENVAENFRVCDKSFGFFMESVSTDFEHGDLPIPPASWRTFFMSADIKSLWLPRGGGVDSTILVQLSRFGVPAALPSSLLKRMVQMFAPNLVEDAVGAARRASEPGSRWHQRLHEDSDGFYRELREAEAAAAKRGSISLDTLPGPEILPQGLTSDGATQQAGALVYLPI